MSKFIHACVDGQSVEGRITSLSVNDITVEITRPFVGISAGLHIPGFALFLYRYEQDGKLTPHGRKTAQQLLVELYQACCFCEANEEAVLAECDQLRARSRWLLLSAAWHQIDWSGLSWYELPLWLVLVLGTDLQLVSECREVIRERFGVWLPESLVRRLLGS